MGKFTREEMLEMIAEYHERKMTQNAICLKHGISKSSLRYILERYKKNKTDDNGMGKLHIMLIIGI